jgi:hypothetical protein
MSGFRGMDYDAVQQRGRYRRGREPKGQTDPLKSTARQLAEKYPLSEKTIKRLVVDRAFLPAQWTHPALLAQARPGDDILPAGKTSGRVQSAWSRA